MKRKRPNSVVAEVFSRRSAPGFLFITKGGIYASFAVADIEAMIQRKVLDPLTKAQVVPVRIIPQLVTRGIKRYLRFKFTLDPDCGNKLWQSSLKKSHRLYFSPGAALRAAGIPPKSIAEKISVSFAKGPDYLEVAATSIIPLIKQGSRANTCP